VRSIKEECLDRLIPIGERHFRRRDGVRRPLDVLICDRDRKWSGDVRRRLRDAGIHFVLIPERATNANAYATAANGITKDSTNGSISGAPGAGTTWPRPS